MPASAKRSNRRGLAATTKLVTATSTNSNIATPRSARIRRSRTATAPSRRMAVVAHAQRLGHAGPTEQPGQDDHRTRQRHDGDRLERGDRRPWHGDLDRRERGDGPLRYGDEGQGDPRDEQPQGGAGNETDGGQRRVLERQPARELTGRQAERPEQRELSHALAGGDRRADDESDDRE